MANDLEVTVLYRLVGTTHVFQSTGIKGLVHVGSHDKDRAWRGFTGALAMHIAEAYGAGASYRLA